MESNVVLAGGASMVAVVILVLFCGPPAVGPLAQRDAVPTLESRTCGSAVAALGPGPEPLERHPCHAIASANSRPGDYLRGYGTGRENVPEGI